MDSRGGQTALLLLAAAAVLALAAAVWFYGSLLPPGTDLPAGRGGALLLCGLLAAGLCTGAWWLWRRGG